MQNVKKKALNLSYFSAIYHVLEGLVSIIVGSSAGSIALLGFGFDSVVESLSGFIVIWRLQTHGKHPKKEEERLEKKALNLIAYSFFILAVYVLFESAKKLYLNQSPKPTLFGIGIAVVSILIMPILFVLKRKTGKLIKSHSMVADARQQLACILLSLALLVGLGLNYFFGFWQADPLIGLLIGFWLVREGIIVLKEKQACAC